MRGEDQATYAPVYTVPPTRIVSVEHPCIVNNIDVAFRSLGGEHQLKPVLEQDGQDINRSRDGKSKQHAKAVVGLSLRPNDPHARRIPSTAMDTQNVLLKITLPKPTGRKRKRGSDEPFIQPQHSSLSEQPLSGPNLLRRLRDNAENYNFEPVGTILNTHRFDILPDLQTRSSEVPIMRELRRHVMTPDYDVLKQFHVDLTPGSQGLTTFPPPPFFIPTGHQYNYDYQPNETVNSKKSSHGQHTRKLLTTYDPKDSIPSAPPPSLRTPTDPKLLDAISKFRDLLTSRPIITRRAACNLLHPIKPAFTIAAIDHVGYYVSSGPWRDAIVAYGVDPGSDPRFRIYQTMSCHIKDLRFPRPSRNNRGSAAAAAATADEARKDGHIFDGENLPVAGKRWQFCDFTDAILQDLVHTENLLPQCDMVGSGWYHGGTISKIRMVTREKTRAVVTGERRLQEEDYRALASMPDAVPEWRSSIKLMPGRSQVLLRCLRLVRKETLGRFASQNHGNGGADSPEGRSEGRDGGIEGQADGDGDLDFQDDDGQVDDEDDDARGESEVDELEEDDEEDEMENIDPRLQGGGLA